MNEVCIACGFDPTVPVALVADLSVRLSFPSQNQLGANRPGGAGWHYRKLRQEFAGALHAALVEAQIPQATVRRRLWLRRVYGKRKRAYDVANLIGGGKHIIDVLVSRGLLKDDSPRWLEGIYAQEPGPEDLIIIRLEDFVLGTVTGDL